MCLNISADLGLGEFGLARDLLPGGPADVAMQPESGDSVSRIRSVRFHVRVRVRLAVGGLGVR
jgi:hypothetical protein